MNQAAIVRPAVNPKALAKLEAKVDAAEATYVDVGRALDGIRKLFRESGQDSDAFEAHCFSVWGWSRATVYEKMQAAEIFTQVRYIGPGPGSIQAALALSPLDEAARKKVWKVVVDNARGRVTVAAVAQAVALHQLADPAGRIQQLGAKALAGMDAEEAKAVIEGEEKKVVEQAPPPKAGRSSKGGAEDGQKALVKQMGTYLDKLGKLIDRWEGDRDAAHERLGKLRQILEEPV